MPEIVKKLMINHFLHLIKNLNVGLNNLDLNNLYILQFYPCLNLVMRKE